VTQAGGRSRDSTCIPPSVVCNDGWSGHGARRTGRPEPRGSEGVLGGVDFLILPCGRENEYADIFGFKLGAIVRYLLLRNSARIFTAKTWKRNTQPIRARRYAKVIALCLIRQFCRVSQVEPNNRKGLLCSVERDPYFGWLLRNQPITTNQAN
jgi:hypothetical protein